MNKLRTCMALLTMALAMSVATAAEPAGEPMLLDQMHVQQDFASADMPMVVAAEHELVMKGGDLVSGVAVAAVPTYDLSTDGKLQTAAYAYGAQEGSRLRWRTPYIL